MRIVYAALVALAVTAPQFIVRVPAAVVGVALSCADATTRCVPSEYATIALADAAATPGDDSIVWVSAGTYSVTVALVSGTSGHPITLLANGVVTVCGMTASSKSYARVIGFTVDPTAGSCGGSPATPVSITGTNTGLEFWNDTVGNTSTSSGIYNGGISDRCHKCILIGNLVHDVVGGNSSIALIGDDTYQSYNNITGACFIGIGGYGSRNRYVNDNFSTMIQCLGKHPDFFYIDSGGCCGVTAGYSTNLVEAMFGQGTPTSDDNKIFHAENQSAQTWVNDVWRFNVVTNTGSASAFSMYSDTGGNTSTNWKFYNSTHVFGSRSTANSGSQICGNIQNNGGGALSYDVFDTLYYECWGTNATTSILPWSTTNPTTKDYNLAFSPNHSVTMAANWATQAHPKTNVDPLLTNVGGLDFTLQSGSPARAAGGALTTTVGSGSSSTSLTVATNGGAFFIGDNSANLPQYGGHLVPGDFITVGTTSVQVSSVSGDVLTLASAISWSNGDPVYFGSTSTIDIGAYPYKAGGYTLSGTYHQSGSTVTVTPNDATLARFAVVYENLIPTCIADAGNAWACTVGSGVVTVSLYPRYASQTQSVAATGT